MKKILIWLFIIIWIITSANISLADCNQSSDSGWFSVWDALDSCLSDSSLVDWTDAWINTWLGASYQIQVWVDNISLYLWLFAVGSIVFGALMMTFSWWEEEKLKKWKDVVKWWIIWFIWLLSVAGIINLIVKIMYSV